MIRLDPGDEVTVTLTLHLAVPETGDTVYVDNEMAEIADWEIDQEFVRIDPHHGTGSHLFEIQDLTANVEHPATIAVTRRG